MKSCPKCKASVSDTAKFCIKCGFNIKKHEEENSKHFCPECGTEFSGGNFCPECGYDISKDLDFETKPKKQEIDFDDFDLGLEAPKKKTTKVKKESKKKEISLDDFDLDDAESFLDNKIKEEKTKQEFVFFEYEKVNKGYVIKKFIDTIETDVVIPDSVVGIDDKAFEKSMVISVKLPEGIKVIGKRAFADCKYLESINLPKSIMRIDDEAFINCVNLDFEIPESISILGKDPYKNTLALYSAEQKAKEALLAKEKEAALKKAKALEEAKLKALDFVDNYAKEKNVISRLDIDKIKEASDTTKVNNAKKAIIKFIDDKVTEREEALLLTSAQQKVIKELKVAAKKKVVCYESSYTKEVQATKTLKELEKLNEDILKRMDDIAYKHSLKKSSTSTSNAKASSLNIAKQKAKDELDKYCRQFRVLGNKRGIDEAKSQEEINLRLIEAKALALKTAQSRKR